MSKSMIDFIGQDQDGNSSKPLLPTVFEEATQKANEIEEQVSIFLSRVCPNYDYRMVVEIAIFTAQHTKSQTPMYTGNLNPKWKLYDTTIDILNGRVKW